MEDKSSMDIAEAINKRKSIRDFKSDPVPQDILKEIMECALRAPSGANTQPWEFVIVAGSKLETIRKDLTMSAQTASVPFLLPGNILNFTTIAVAL